MYPGFTDNANLVQCGKTDASSPSAGKRAKSEAAEYVRQLMEARSRLREAKPVPDAIAHTIILQSEPSLPKGEDWTRMVLEPGVELHVRNPRSTEMESLVSEIMACVKKRAKSNR